MHLKIVILGPAHPFRGGGITTFNERLAKELILQKQEVSILNFTVQYPGFLFPGKSQFTQEAAPDGIPIERRLHSMNPLNWVRTGRYLRRQNPDLIIVRYWLPFMGPAFGTVLRSVRKNRHTKIIAIADNINPHEKRPGDKLFTTYFAKACDAFICMSEKVLQDLRPYLSKQPAITLQHPLYDNFGEKIPKELAREHLQLPSGSRLLLFFGFIRKYKGLDILLKAMKALNDPSILLLVAGEFYEDPAIYYQMAAELGISHQVIFRNDFIPNEEVKYYFSATDLVVQPYRSATQSGVTPLAYHFEKPMIVTNVGALPDYVPHGKAGFVCEPQPEALADAIKAFFRLGEATFTENIKVEKQKFSWGVFSRSLLQLYTGLSEPKHHANKD